MTEAAIICAAYVLGCCNTGYYLVRFRTGADIRSMASGGTGSRNVGRALGATGFLCTFIGDAGKGALAVWLARQAGPAEWLPMAALVAAVLGHIFPAQLGFRGGKGFATLAGGLALSAPVLLASGFALSMVFLAFLRRSTMSGLLALSASPGIAGLLRVGAGRPLVAPDFALYVLLVLLVLYGHRDNIHRDFFGARAAVAGE